MLKGWKCIPEVHYDIIFTITNHDFDDFMVKQKHLDLRNNLLERFSSFNIDSVEFNNFTRGVESIIVNVTVTRKPNVPEGE